MTQHEVVKTFKFDAAHRLIDGYEGKCSNLHGHTWKVSVSLMGTELNEFGMLFDFNDFKPLKDWIDDRLDHATILNVMDVLVDVLQEHGQRLYTMIDNPTSENIAKEIYYKAKNLLVKGLDTVELSYVEVWESENSRAVFYG